MPDLKITNDGSIIDDYELGIDYLAGVVVDNLLNTISTDLYSPDFGTTIKTLPRFNVISKNQLMIELTLIIEQIKKRILEEQLNNPSTDDEMLDDIVINDIMESIDPKTLQSFWELDITVYSKAGTNKNLITDQILKL